MRFNRISGYNFLGNLIFLPLVDTPQDYEYVPLSIHGVSRENDFKSYPRMQVRLVGFPRIDIKKMVQEPVNTSMTTIKRTYLLPENIVNISKRCILYITLARLLLDHDMLDTVHVARHIQKPLSFLLEHLIEFENDMRDTRLATRQSKTFTPSLKLITEEDDHEEDLGIPVDH